MPKNILSKNKKNPLSKKVFKSKKLQKWPKKGQKWPFFGPPGPNFAKIKKRLGHSLTFTPERLYTKFQKIWLIRLGENALRTDGQTDGTEIIGPSGKIPGTNECLATIFWQPPIYFVPSQLFWVSKFYFIFNF